MCPRWHWTGWNVRRWRRDQNKCICLWTRTSFTIAGCLRRERLTKELFEVKRWWWMNGMPCWDVHVNDERKSSLSFSRRDRNSSMCHWFSAKESKTIDPAGEWRVDYDEFFSHATPIDLNAQRKVVMSRYRLMWDISCLPVDLLGKTNWRSLTTMCQGDRTQCKTISRLVPVAVQRRTGNNWYVELVTRCEIDWYSHGEDDRSSLEENSKTTRPIQFVSSIAWKILIAACECEQRWTVRTMEILVQGGGNKRAKIISFLVDEWQKW